VDVSCLIEDNLRVKRVVLDLVDGVDDEDKMLRCASNAGILIPSRHVVAQPSLRHHRVSMVLGSIHFPVFNRSGPAWIIAGGCFQLSSAQPYQQVQSSL
jgi:hypothetical protein